MSPEVTAFFDEATNTISYVVRDPQGSACAIVDSVLDFDYSSGRTDTRSADAIIAFVTEKGYEVQWLLESHVHADHLSAAPYIQEKLGGQIGIGDNIRIVQDTFGKVFNEGTEFQRDGSQFDRLFVEGDSFHIGQLRGNVLHTPGHTPACLTYVIGDAAFVGDTLFMPDFGTARCDFPGGSSEMLYTSIQKILALPDLPVCAQCCRVPVAVGHYINAWIELRDRVELPQIAAVLEDSASAFVRFVPGASGEGLSALAGVHDRDRALVGRLRLDPRGAEGTALCITVTADNLRLGAATNAVRMASRWFPAADPELRVGG